MDRPVATNPALLAAALRGLGRRPKRLEAKWFYDARGSALFEEITRLPEYYPTRVETGILAAHAARLAAQIPPGAALVELGSGASAKTRLLLDAAPHLGAYCPLDISAEFLRSAAAALAADYPALNVRPVIGDFTAGVALPPAVAQMPKAVFFPGSTIGNLSPEGAVALLARLGRWPGAEVLILGADLVKDRETLIAAYDDAAGVTAAFNLNLLHRLNREAGATFDPAGFRHEARWNLRAARIEMHLVSRRAQVVDVAGRAIPFAAGESIHTENSHKYTRPRLEAMAARAGWRMADWLTDAAGMFSVSVLRRG